MFEDGAILTSGPLKKELAWLQKSDELQMKLIVKQYVYNLESIKDEYLQ